MPRSKEKYKSMTDYLQMPWTYTVHKSDDPRDPWTVRVQQLPGCMTHGKTPQEALGNVAEAIESYVLSLMATDQPIPEPVSAEKFKGTIVVRTTPENHYKMAIAASLTHKSINKLMEEGIERVLADLA